MRSGTYPSPPGSPTDSPDEATNEGLLGAFAAVPREQFVEGALRRRLAYLPMPVPIGKGQTLSQPWIVAKMIALAELRPTHVVLDVGSGSGYQTALLARLCRHVHGVEILPELAVRARAVLAALGVRNATIHVADGARGLPEHAPFDVILVAAAAQAVPDRLLAQLADGGRLIVPIGQQLSKPAMALRMMFGRKAAQQLNRFTRRGEHFEREVLDGVHFVPFVGA